MIGKSRKKIDILNYKKGEHSALPSFSLKKVDKDEFIIKDLGIKHNEPLKSHKRINLKIVAVVVFVMILLSTLLFVVKFINFNVTEMIWKTSVTRGSDNINNKSIKYDSFNNGLMRISNDGITYISDIGEVKWTISYNMKDPIYESNGDHFAIADRNGNEFYIFNERGLSGKNTVTNPIQKISLSKDGILYILQSDEENSYINVYREDGKIIDLSIKTTLTSDGMAVDLGTSASGEELAVAYVCLLDNKIFTKATYYNFGDVGQNINSKRIVADFVDEFENKFLARTYFFDDNNSFLVYDGGVYFVSTKNKANPEIIENREFNIKIRSISYNKKFIAIVFEDNRMLMYDKNGVLLADKTIDFDYENFYISDDYAIFLYGNRIMIYDSRGRMIFDKEMEFEVQYVAKKKNLLFTELLVGLIDGVECIRFY